MLVSQVTPYGTAGVGVTLLTAVKSTTQTARTSVPAAPNPVASKPYEVELSGMARAQSLHLQGFSAQMISVKLGLDMNMVNQFLGNIEPSVTTTYVEPKKMYQEPKALAQGREQLGTDLTQLNLIRYAWDAMAGKSKENVLLV